MRSISLFFAIHTVGEFIAGNLVWIYTRIWHCKTLPLADTFAVSLTLKICRIWSLPKAGFPNLVITNVIPAFYSEKSRYWYFDNKDAMYTSVDKAR